jgi:prephenate dehydrogenase
MRLITITIYGVGLIGGSLALCFKDRPGFRVVGHSNNPASVEKYMKRNVVDYATTDLEEAAQDADFIFLCVPVGQLANYLRRLAALPLKKGCIITDVGSTKLSIAETARQLGLHEGEITFIGGHPMAGKEKSGVEAATSLLFENAFYVLTPDPETPPEATERLSALLGHTRSHIVKMDAAQHDNIVGAISHLPHIIAVALVNQICDYNAGNSMYQNLAAGGFRDITRIASSDPVVWRDILVNNREVLLRLLKDWNVEIAKLTDMIEACDASGIEEQFRKANEFRSQLPERRKGVLLSYYELYMDVPDHPGIVGHIATLLGQEGINLSNLQIIESRVDVPGILRLSFSQQLDLDKAVQLLKSNGYTVNI